MLQLQRMLEDLCRLRTLIGLWLLGLGKIELQEEVPLEEVPTHRENPAPREVVEGVQTEVGEEEAGQEEVGGEEGEGEMTMEVEDIAFLEVSVVEIVLPAFSTQDKYILPSSEVRRTIGDRSRLYNIQVQEYLEDTLGARLYALEFV